MIGYKAFDKNLQCRGFQYEVGKTYVKETPKEELKLCTNKVFHFCRELHCIEKCSDYKLSESRICEVIAGNDIIVSDDRTKYGTNKLTILREIVGDEKNNLINSGYRNSGNYNSGDRNSGNYNSGNYNSGYCNSKNAPVRMFNKETSAQRNEIEFPDFFHFEMTVFVSYDTASDIERKAHKKEMETCGGYLRTISYKEAWRKSWDKADDADRRKVLNLPNWNNEVFFEITGIDVEKELGIKK